MRFDTVSERRTVSANVLRLEHNRRTVWSENPDMHDNKIGYYQ